MIETIINHVQGTGLMGLIGGYLLGSIPFGLVLCFMAGYGDIRKIGSGNIGATNVLRTGNKPLALLTLILDSSKGAIAVLTAAYFSDTHAMFGAALGAVLGHNFPIWLKFKGGKGIATTFGTIIALAWPIGLMACLTWLASAVLFRTSSLAALIAMACAPVYALYMGYENMFHLLLALAILAYIRHQANIRRIFAGTEPKIGDKKKDKHKK